MSAYLSAFGAKRTRTVMWLRPPRSQLTQSGHWHDRNPALERVHSARVSSVALPRISHGAGAGVGGGVGGELTVEFGEQCDAVGEAKLRAGQGECGILRRDRAVDHEARLVSGTSWRNSYQVPSFAS